jgi:riboflavin transporter FmnP
MLVITNDLQPSVRTRNQLIVGGAVFGALSVILTTISQALVLSFPLIPYLQFDLGEIAIILAFFIFGPAPAMTASVIEFVTLMAIGQNAPVGPVLKLVAIVSSLVGIWMGMAVASRRSHPSVGKATGLGTSIGLVTRVIMTTPANYVVIILVYTVNGIVGFVSASFLLIGVTLTEGNALVLVLGFTAVFNVLQLVFVAAVSYFLLRLPQVKNVGALGKPFWVTSYIHSRE